MDFRRESLREASTEILDLAKLHFREVSSYQNYPLDVELKRFEALEKASALFIFTARKEQKLCGYGNFIVGPASHYRSLLSAHCDSIFLLPDVRGHAMSFFRYCEKELKELGVKTLSHSVTKKRDFGSLLRLLGYEHFESIYKKEISK